VPCRVQKQAAPESRGGIEEQFEVVNEDRLGARNQDVKNQDAELTNLQDLLRRFLADPESDRNNKEPGTRNQKLYTFNNSTPEAMKKLFLALPLLALLTGSSCKKVDEITEFDLNYSTDQAIPGSSVSTSATVDFVSPDIPTQSSEKFAAQGTAKEYIDEIKLTKFTMSSNTLGNFDYLRSVSVFMKAEGLDEVLIASKNPVPKGTRYVQMDPTGANIKQHIFKDKIQLRISLTVDSLPAKDQSIKLEQTLRVKGKKLSKK